MKSTRQRRALFALIGVLFLIAAGTRVDSLFKSLPYPRNIDEPVLAGHALEMVDSGDWNPHFFQYPSLPFYLTAVGMQGAISWGRFTGEFPPAGRLPLPQYPYYEEPLLMLGPRLLFIALSLGTLALTALLATWIAGSAWAAVLTLAFAILSPNIFYHAWSYLNVDTPASFFALLSITAAVAHLRGKTGRFSLFRLGLPVGLTLACKYNLGLVALPVFFAILFDGKPRRIGRLFLTGGISLATFLLAVPFSWLDFPAFSTGMTYELDHYVSGHPGASYYPGLNHLLAMGGYFLGEIGPVVALLALIGLVAAVAQRGARRAGTGDLPVAPTETMPPDHRHVGIVFIAFPLAFIAFMSLFKVFFVRNLLAATHLLAALAAIGALALVRFAAERLGGALRKRRRLVAVALSAALAVAVLLTLNWEGLAKEYTLRPDSRNHLVHWLEKHLPAGMKILIPSELGMDVEPLRKNYRVELVPFKWLPLAENDEILRRNTDAVIVRPFYAMDERFAIRGHRPETLNDYFARRTKTARLFGAYPAMVNHNPNVRGGDPLFAVGTVAPRAKKDLGISDRAWRRQRPPVLPRDTSVLAQWK